VCQIINDQLCCLQLLHSLFDIHLHIHYAVFMPTFLSLLSCQMVFHVDFSLITFCAILKNACVRFAALFLSTSILPIGTSIVFVLMACSSDGRVVGHRLPCTHDYCLIQVTIVSAIPSRIAAAQSRTVTETQVFSTIIDCFLPSCYHER